jgi:hypothetical protein
MQFKLVVPAWVIALVFIFFVVALVTNKGIKNESIDSKKLVKYEAKSFGNQTVLMDGKEFIKCDFISSKLLFESKHPTSMSGCNLENITIQFGENAQLTLSIISALYRDLHSFRPHFDAMFESIKAGTMPMAPPTFEL